MSLPATGTAIHRPLVLVTGAARRLGREISLQFARGGWDVAAHYHRSEAEAQSLAAEIGALGGACHPVAADLARADVAAQLLDAVQAAAGRLPHCLVNSAALFAHDDAWDATPSSLQAHFEVNARAPLLLANALARRVRAGGQEAGGAYSVVHVLDQKVHNLNPDYFSYTLSKLTLAGGVALQAQALAPWVRVCGVSPGLLYLSGPQTQSNFAAASRVNLLRRPVEPADVARCALFIAGNRSLNGTTLQADNGQHLVALDRDVMFAVEPGGIGG